MKSLQLYFTLFIGLTLTGIACPDKQQPNSVVGNAEPSANLEEVNAIDEVELKNDSSWVERSFNSADTIVDDRIAGGTTATPNEYPWQAYLLLFSTQSAINPTYACGGTLISDRWVLTAAACLSGIVKADVWLGAHNIAAGSETYRRVYSASSIIKHLGFIAGYNYANIGLVQISINVPLTNQIKPINLPYLNDPTHEGNTVIITGWGSQYSTPSTTGLMMSTLQKISTTVISNSLCSFYLGTINSDMICSSGNNNKGICPGDNGGPMMYQFGSSFTLIGVASFWLSAGCSNGYPSGFTRVSSYLNWISAQTGIQVYNAAETQFNTSSMGMTLMVSIAIALAFRREI